MSPRPLLALVACGLLGCDGGGTGASRAPILYGTDDRHDRYQLTDPGQIGFAEGGFALVPNNAVTDLGNGAFALDVGTLYGKKYHLCPDEPYVDQPVAADCSGFLAGPQH